jgi:hypothetical protein
MHVFNIVTMYHAVSPGSPDMAQSPKLSTKGAVAPRTCIFCQQPKPMSQEHIWGDWLKAHIPLAMNKHNMQAVRINQPGEPTTGNIFLRAGDPLRSTVKVVCADCNNQWLSEIQSRAKPFLIPLIKGERTALGTDAQQRVSAWCAMATMMAEYIDRDPHTIAVPQSDRDWLLNNGTAPPGAHLACTLSPAQMAGTMGSSHFADPRGKRHARAGHRMGASQHPGHDLCRWRALCPCDELD